ncbi:MAG: hypothetical protein WC824_07780, partial [Bacteroidota bacterium]
QQRFDFDEIYAMPALIGGKLVFRTSMGNFDKLVVISDRTEEFQIGQIASIASPDLGENARRIIAMNDHLALLSDFNSSNGEVLADLTTGITSVAHVAMRNTNGVPSNGSAVTAAAGDMDGDGAIEVVMTGADILVASNTDDATIADLRFSDYDRVDLNTGLTHAAMADVDGDGRLDAVLSGQSELRVLNYSLSSIEHYPAPYPMRFALSADLGSGHGHAVFGVANDRIWQFTTGARQADGFPIPLAAAADVVLFPSGSGRLSIAAASPEGSIFVYETGNSITQGQLIWRSRNCDERNSFSVTRPFTASAPIQDFFPLERCYNWPNPVYADITYIRLYAAEPADVTIKVYDLAGDKVDEITAHVAGGTDNDIPWNVSNIQSDTYLAHVEVTAAGKKGEKIIKIAVVK